MSYKYYVSAVELNNGQKFYCEREELRKYYYLPSAALDGYNTTVDWMDKETVKKVQEIAENYSETFDSVRYMTCLRIAGERAALEVIYSRINAIEFLAFEDGKCNNTPKVEKYIVDFEKKKIFCQKWKENEEKLSEPVECKEYYLLEFAQEILLKGLTESLSKKVEW